MAFDFNLFFPPALYSYKLGFQYVLENKEVAFRFRMNRPLSRTVYCTVRLIYTLFESLLLFCCSLIGSTHTSATEFICRVLVIGSIAAKIAAAGFGNIVKKKSTLV